MGCISSTKHKSTTPKTISNSNLICLYGREATAKIKVKTPIGKSQNYQKISFRLSDPMIFDSQNVQIRGYDTIISTCVLPGCDPRQEVDKKCQDYSLFVNDDSSILLSLFDGHGGEGERIVAFCARVVQDFFPQNKALAEVKIM